MFFHSFHIPPISIPAISSCHPIQQPCSKSSPHDADNVKLFSMELPELPKVRGVSTVPLTFQFKRNSIDHKFMFILNVLASLYLRLPGITARFNNQVHLTAASEPVESNSSSCK